MESDVPLGPSNVSCVEEIDPILCCIVLYLDHEVSAIKSNAVFVVPVDKVRCQLAIVRLTLGVLVSLLLRIESGILHYFQLFLLSDLMAVNDVATSSSDL